MLHFENVTHVTIIIYFRKRNRSYKCYIFENVTGVTYYACTSTHIQMTDMGNITVSNNVVQVYAYKL